MVGAVVDIAWWLEHLAAPTVSAMILAVLLRMPGSLRRAAARLIAEQTLWLSEHAADDARAHATLALGLACHEEHCPACMELERLHKVESERAETIRQRLVRERLE
jgi:hypothetical protein